MRLSLNSAVLLVLGVLAVFAIRNAFAGAQRVLGWAAASIVVAVLVEPLANLLGRWIPRVAAVLLTFLVVGVGVGALVFGTVADLDREVDRLQRAAPSATERLESRDDRLGEVARDLELTSRIEVFLDEVDERVGSGGSTLAQNAPTAPVYFVSAILTVFLLVYGPGIVIGGIDRIEDDERRRFVRATLTDAAIRARRTVTAFLLQGLVVGLAVFGVGSAIDLPAPIVLGLVAGVAAMLPDVGILLGVLPTIALTAGLENARTAVLILAAAFLLQMFEALYVRQRVDRWGVAVGPAVIWIVALVGYTLHGPGLAVYGVIYAIFGLAVIDRAPAARALPAA